MIANLDLEQEEEVKTRDQCKEDIFNNEQETTAKEGEKADVQNSIDTLTTTITNLKDEVATLKSEIDTALIEMKRASEDRQAENADFQQTVNDQRQTQAILAKAIDRLKDFYTQHFLLQVGASRGKRQDPGSFG